MGLWRTLTSRADAQGFARRRQSLRRAGLPLCLLVEHAVGLRTCHRLPVRERLAPVVPCRPPAPRGDSRRLFRLPLMVEKPLDLRDFSNEGDHARDVRFSSLCRFRCSQGQCPLGVDNGPSTVVRANGSRNFRCPPKTGGRRDIHSWQIHCSERVFVSCGRVEGLLCTDTGDGRSLLSFDSGKHALSVVIQVFDGYLRRLLVWPDLKGH
jgi:hypothetical protein